MAATLTFFAVTMASWVGIVTYLLVLPWLLSRHFGNGYDFPDDHFPGFLSTPLVTVFFAFMAGCLGWCFQLAVMTFMSQRSEWAECLPFVMIGSGVVLGTDASVSSVLSQRRSIRSLVGAAILGAIIVIVSIEVSYAVNARYELSQETFSRRIRMTTAETEALGLSLLAATAIFHSAVRADAGLRRQSLAAPVTQRAQIINKDSVS